MYNDNKDLQLLRDVDMRWSSTLLMIKRALELEQVCLQISLSLHGLHLNFSQPLDVFLSSPEFEDLRKYELSNEEWNALVVAHEILLVSLWVSLRINSSSFKSPGSICISTKVIGTQNTHSL